MKSPKKKKHILPAVDRANAESVKLDALNMRTRRHKTDVTRLIEASIESKAKKRREQEAPASASWKQSG